MYSGCRWPIKAEKGVSLKMSNKKPAAKKLKSKPVTANTNANASKHQNQSQEEVIRELAKVLGKPVILQCDAKILREYLAGLIKYLPPQIAVVAIKILKQYADAVKPYCQCPEKVYIEKENRHACLDCGYRHKKAGGDRSDEGDEGDAVTRV